MTQDLKFAARTLRRTPSFTLAALVCLACGVGVTTTIFSAVSGILLRPLPYVRDHELVVVHARQTDQPSGPVSWAEYVAWRDGTRTLTDLGLWLTRAAVSAVLALVALVATVVPARRAANVDPMVALRDE